MKNGTFSGGKIITVGKKIMGKDSEKVNPSLFFHPF